jgi:hypothetical protein
MNMRDRVKAEANALTARDKSNKFMAAKLLEMVENEKITWDFDCGFIRSCVARLEQGLSLTEKQDAYLDKLFNEKY